MTHINDSNLFSGCCGMIETTFYNAETGICGECRQRCEYVVEWFDEDDCDNDAVNALIAKSAAYLALACMMAYLAGFVSSGGLI